MQHLLVVLAGINEYRLVCPRATCSIGDASAGGKWHLRRLNALPIAQAAKRHLAKKHECTVGNCVEDSKQVTCKLPGPRAETSHEMRSCTFSMNRL